MANLSPTTVARFWSKASIPPVGRDGCWTWKGAVAGSGYGSFHVPALGSTSSHRIAYGLVYGQWPGPNELVRHICDNPRCVNPYHLELGDHVDNARDMMERGRNVVHDQAGGRNGNAKLTAADVECIRGFFGDGFNNKQIARWFNVHHATISAIRRGKSWASPSVPAR